MSCRLLKSPRHAFIAFLGVASLTAADQRPNILFIAIDDLRPELGCYGAPQVKSPQIDRFAATAVRFDRAYCQVPVCGASRASLMTSILPTASRFTVADSSVDGHAPGVATLPHVFKDAGYVTIANGKVYHSPKDNREGWSEAPWVVEAGHASSFDPESQRERSPTGRGRIYEHPDVPDNAYADGKIAEKTIQDLRRFKQSGQPFLLFCGFIRPHMPFYAPKKYWDLYDRKDIIVAENRSRPEKAPAALQGSAEFKQYHLGEYQPNTDAFHRMMRHGYLASVSYTDKLVGDVLTALEDLGLAQNTIVVLWGDHGWNLGEHDFWGKHNTMHTALRVPLIVRAPGLEKGVSKALVASVDIFPTLCALAKVEAPSTVQGRSFVNLLEKPDRKFRDMIYSRFRAGDTALTERFSYTSYGKNGEMLYDLLKDPAENHNVVASPEYRGDYERMKQLLAGAMQEAAQAKLPVAAK